MKKIFVQKRLTLANAIIISAILVIVGLTFVFLAFTNKYVSIQGRNACFAIASSIVVLVPLLLKNTKSTKAYVSELIITDEDLILVYKTDNNIEKKVIKLADISSLYAKLDCFAECSGTTFFKTAVSIETHSQGDISFIEDPSANLFSCHYAFLLRLLDVSDLLPNFNYYVFGPSWVEEDIKHFAKYGKRLSLIQRAFVQNPVWTKILLAFICISISIFIYLFIMMQRLMPH